MARTDPLTGGPCHVTDPHDPSPDGLLGALRVGLPPGLRAGPGLRRPPDPAARDRPAAGRLRRGGRDPPTEAESRHDREREELLQLRPTDPKVVAERRLTEGDPV